MSPLNIPQQLEKTISSYELFYGKQFSGRKLTWLYNLCNGDIKLGYLSKPYIVTMSTFQVSKKLKEKKKTGMQKMRQNEVDVAFLPDIKVEIFR